MKILVRFDAKKGKISTDNDDDNVWSTKVSDNYPGQGHTLEMI